MRKVVLLLAIIGSLSVKAQTVTFNGCHPMFENQDFVFSLDGTDASGRNSYSTSPVDGEQTCGALGTCEFKILWNAGSSRWEFVADSGNGDFVNPHLIFYNSSSSTPNPPDLSLGVWVENTVVTNSDCAGDLTAENAVLSGAVQSTVLSNDGFSVTSNTITLYPNPTTDRITLVSSEIIEGFSVMTLQGQVVMEVLNSNVADVSMLQSGVYFVRVKGGEFGQLLRFLKK